MQSWCFSPEEIQSESRLQKKVRCKKRSPPELRWDKWPKKELAVKWQSQTFLPSCQKIKHRNAQCVRIILLLWWHSIKQSFSFPVCLHACRSADVTVSMLHCEVCLHPSISFVLTQLSVCLSSAQKHCTHCFLVASCDCESEGWLGTSQPKSPSQSRESVLSNSSIFKKTQVILLRLWRGQLTNICCSYHLRFIIKGVYWNCINWNCQYSSHTFKYLHVGQEHT